jgi:hypothetical protein
VTGALVGLALVGLGAGTLHACSAVRGTPTCGNAGIVPLLAITVAVTLLGCALLRLLGVRTYAGTGLLGVALLVVVLLLAVPLLSTAAVVVVVPGVSVLTHLGGWWLTTAYAEPAHPPR